jgi:hypothetical protein
MEARPPHALPWSPTLRTKPPRTLGCGTSLEVALAKDAALVWSEWRRSKRPTIDDKLTAISYYALHDAYLPLS